MTQAGFSCLMEESLGKQWYFSLTEQQIIQYTWRDGNSWVQPAHIDGQPVKQFRVTIDRNDRIHLLAYNTSKHLIYYQWNGEQWYKRLLYRLQSRFEDISCLEILCTLNKVHILYYIENALKRAQESLIHAWLENSKWQSNVLLNFLSDQRIKPQLVQNDAQGNLYCIYTRIIRNQTRCYYIYYNNNHASWSKPFILFQQSGTCTCFDGHADSAGDFHLIWLEKAGPEYRLNYLKIHPTAPKSNNEILCILDSGAQPIQNPCLQIGNGLHCYWIQDGIGFVSRGDMSGRHWMQPQEMIRNKIESNRKITKTLDGNSRFETEFGDGYPDFSWTLKTLLTGENAIKEKPIIQASGLRSEKKPDLSDSSPEDEKEQALFRTLKEVRNRMNEFQAKLKDMNDRMDDFQAALYQMQDYIRQKDKYSFQKEAQIRKLAFELEQMRAMRANIPVISSAGYKDEEKAKPSASDLSDEISIEHAHPNDEKDGTETELQYSLQGDDLHQSEDLPLKKNPPKNVDSGSGEIQLDNVRILINPEEESEEG